MNRLLVGIMLLAIVCIAGSCTDEDEYTQGQWMKKPAITVCTALMPPASPSAIMDICVAASTERTRIT